MERRNSKSAMWGRAIPDSAMWKQRTLLTLGAAILTASLGFAESPKISQDLAGTNGSGQRDVIVQFHHAPAAKDHHEVLSRGARLRREPGIVKGSAYTISAARVAEPAADADVVCITPHSPHGAGNGPTLDYHNQTVNASAASLSSRRVTRT